MLLALAMLPSLLFFSLIHIQQIGHAMAYVPFFVIVVAAAGARVTSARSYPVMASGLVAANLAFVFFYPSRLVGDKIGTPTVATLRERDAAVRAVEDIKRHTDLKDTLVIASMMSLSHVEYYLPGYRFLCMLPF